MLVLARENPDAAEFFEDNQIIVARHDDVSLAGNCRAGKTETTLKIETLAFHPLGVY